VIEAAQPPFQPRDLRDAFGCFATGVTVVTGVDPDGRRIGLTANSFTSVSLDPPLLLFCPANGASALPGIRATGRFAVNVLAEQDRAVAERFSQPGVDRFADADWVAWDGLPVLSGAKAAFACSIYADHDGGDHRILVGRIERYARAPNRQALLYFHGRFRQLGDDREAD
jgi:flavin reductase (DIM6/NTAB) family NADH-FMN oxidoreductase RutF